MTSSKSHLVFLSLPTQLYLPIYSVFAEWHASVRTIKGFCSADASSMWADYKTMWVIFVLLLPGLCSSSLRASWDIKTTGYYDACHVPIDDWGYNNLLEDQRRGCIHFWRCVVADCMRSFTTYFHGAVKLICSQESEIATIDVEAHSPGILGKILVSFFLELCQAPSGT